MDGICSKNNQNESSKKKIQIGRHITALCSWLINKDSLYSNIILMDIYNIPKDTQHKKKNQLWNNKKFFHIKPFPISIFSQKHPDAMINTVNPHHYCDSKS